MKTTVKLWIGLAVLAILSPLGLIIPGILKSGDAWGEWGVDKIRELAGYVPAGLEKLAGLWKAPVPDYAFRGWEGKKLSHLGLAYIVSAVAGIAVVAGIILLLGKLLSKKEDRP